MSGELAAKIRLDKWLWQARFVKTRSLAAKLSAEGRVRIDGTVSDKPAASGSRRRGSVAVSRSLAAIGGNRVAARLVSFPNCVDRGGDRFNPQIVQIRTL